MTRAEFAVECGKRLIDVDIALENEKVLQALVAHLDALVLKLLDTEF